MKPPPNKVERRNLTGLDSKNDRAALALTVAVGLVFGLVVGFFAEDTPGSFGRWVRLSVTPGYGGGLREPGLFWCLGGGVMAAAVFYIRVLTRKS